MNFHKGQKEGVGEIKDVVRKRLRIMVAAQGTMGLGPLLPES